MNRVKYSEFINWEKEIGPKDSFLDVGCWSGSTVLRLNNKCDAFGVDFNKNTLALADKRIKNKLVYGNISKSKPFDKKFDWVLMSEVIEHISEDEAALKNISESLKEKGKLILTTPRSIPFLEFWDPAWVRWKLGGNERHHHYSLTELNEKLSKYNLKIKKYTTRGNLAWIIKRWVNVFLQYILRSNKKLVNKWGEGFTGWMIVAEKI